MTPWNTTKCAQTFGRLSNPVSLSILEDLLDGPKDYTFFEDKHGKKIWWPLRETLREGLILKILDKAKAPLGYKITDHGRWVFHSVMNFSKEITVIQ